MDQVIQAVTFKHPPSLGWSPTTFEFGSLNQPSQKGHLSTRNLFKHRRSQESHGKPIPPTNTCSKQKTPTIIYHYITSTTSTTHISLKVLSTFKTLISFDSKRTPRNHFCALPVASFRSFALGLIGDWPPKADKIPFLKLPDFFSQKTN